MDRIKEFRSSARRSSSQERGLQEDVDLDCYARRRSLGSDCSSILSSATGIVRPPCCLSSPMEVAARTPVRRRAK
ncbi:hypothetical protein MRB53_022394 [Persea americana]|uniref:Uncharacterized protein n=1 Tax=Persea americana TaxID=3435 RepID=A0ACC2L6N7_PERAE|nr:hypothetical protein MRB53_022394 [Persea americana]